MFNRIRYLHVRGWGGWVVWSWGMVGGRGVVLDRPMVCYRTMVGHGTVVGNWVGDWGGVLDCLGGQKQQRGENLHKQHLISSDFSLGSDKTIIN